METGVKDWGQRLIVVTEGDVGSRTMGNVLRERRVELGKSVRVSITADGRVGMNERIVIERSMTLMN